ncbi:MAG: class I SAM-dependent methyltransferase [Leptospirales bacterium]|nr:class I SAM-dependent methyltransferase [Leptospirales bacterium]
MKVAAVKAGELAPCKASGNCPVCSAALQPLYRIERFTPPLDILRCSSCRLQIQAHPSLDLAALYEEDYYTGKADYSYRDERRVELFDRHVQRARLKNIARFVPPPADFLDVGAAFGSFVRAASEAGYRARGLDISEYAVKQGRLLGADLRQGDLRSGTLPANSADVITLVEVIEHLSDPQQTMASLSAALRRGGLLLIQTANFDGWQARRGGIDYHYYLPGHVVYYSLQNLRMLLEQHGLQIVAVYRPVDFGLIPKLRKSRGAFQSPLDYFRWLHISWYHLKSKLAWGDFSLTSSMVLYAQKL